MPLRVPFRLASDVAWQRNINRRRNGKIYEPFRWLAWFSVELAENKKTRKKDNNNEPMNELTQFSGLRVSSAENVQKAFQEALKERLRRRSLYKPRRQCVVQANKTSPLFGRCHWQKFFFSAFVCLQVEVLIPIISPLNQPKTESAEGETDKGDEWELILCNNTCRLPY